MAGEFVGAAFIDVYKSTEVKRGEAQDDVDGTFAAYHALVDQAFRAYGGSSWHHMGDGGVYVFPDCRLAVGGAVRLLGDLCAFDLEGNRLKSSIHVRVGIHTVPMALVQGVPEATSGRRPAGDLDIAGKLEKNCPVGKVAISPAVFEELDNVQRALFRESTIGPLAGGSAFVLQHRNTMPREQALAKGLSHAQCSRLPPIPFRDWDRLRPAEGKGLKQLHEVLRGPLLVVLGEASDDPESVVRAAATSDAVGAIEILSAMRANTKVTAGIDRWADTADVACERSLLLVGSGLVNAYAFAFNDLVRPVRFGKADGRIVDRVVVETAEGRSQHGPHADPPKDCGFVVLFNSPVNPTRYAVWIAGITGMGTQAAARCAWDLIDDADASIKERLGSGDFNPIACVVGATTPLGSTDVSSYYRHWRIADYVLVAGIDGSGRVVRGMQSVT